MENKKWTILLKYCASWETLNFLKLSMISIVSLYRFFLFSVHSWKENSKNIINNIVFYDYVFLISEDLLLGVQTIRLSDIRLSHLVFQCIIYLNECTD